MEIWKSIDGFGSYQISNHGNIKSFVIDKSGKPLIARKSQRYLMVKMNGVDKKVHRLVAEAFVENTNNKTNVNHIDGNKHNNHYQNLEWVTSLENSRHAKNIGLYPSRLGEANTQAKLTEVDIIIIREVWAVFGKGSQVKMCQYYKVGSFIMSAICGRKRWKHI